MRLCRLFHREPADQNPRPPQSGPSEIVYGADRRPIEPRPPAATPPVSRDLNSTPACSPAGRPRVNASHEAQPKWIGPHPPPRLHFPRRIGLRNARSWNNARLNRPTQTDPRVRTRAPDPDPLPAVV